MRVIAAIDCRCPECGMWMFPEKDHLRCTTVGCKNENKKFELPTVELKEKKE